MQLAGDWSGGMFGSRGGSGVATDAAAAAAGAVEEEEQQEGGLDAMDSWRGEQEEGGCASVAGSADGWGSPGSLDELVTAVSDLPPPSALASAAASRPPRGAAAFMTPLPQPDWGQAEQASGGSSDGGEAEAEEEEEGVASSGKAGGSASS